MEKPNPPYPSLSLGRRRRRQIFNTKKLGMERP
jgi:hypothetical protein